jgi:hypothetical protein
MEWGDFLKTMTGSGVNAAIGFILSFTTDYWPGYAPLDAKYKRLVFIAAAFLIPLLATAAAIATGEFGQWADWQTTWWPALVAGATAAFAGTLAHTRKLV